MHTNNDTLIRLRSTARDILNYQLERGLSDAKLCSEIAHLGSTKTYKRILDEKDPLEQLDIEKQLKNYEAAKETIRIRRQKDKLAEPEYEDFTNVRLVLSAINRALVEEGMQRFVCVEGDTATGKDASINYLISMWPKITVAVNANTFWAESLGEPTRAIFNALNIVRKRPEDEGGGPLPMPRYPSERAAAIIEELQKRKLILIINEGHHCGPRALDFLKDLINQTQDHARSVVAMFCYPALLRQLIKHHYDTANQLFGNRLCERVYLPPPIPKEIGEMMDRRGARFENASVRNDAMKALASDALTLGNWTYVKLVTRELVIESRAELLNDERWKAARDKVKNRRIPRSMEGRA